MAAVSAVPNATCGAHLNVCGAELDSATAAEEAEPADEFDFADADAMASAPAADADVKPADITAEMAQQSVEPQPSAPDAGCLYS